MDVKIKPAVMTVSPALLQKKEKGPIEKLHSNEMEDRIMIVIRFAIMQR